MRYTISGSVGTFLCQVALIVGFSCIIAPSSAHADTGLVAHWTMDDGSGNVASDSSGYNNNLSINGTATWVAGKILGALSFDGTDNFAYDSSAFNTTPSSTMSLCGWIKTSSPTQQTIMSFGRNPSAFTNEGILSVMASGSIQFWDYSNGGGGPGFPTNGSGSTGIVDDGHWHSICFVKNNTSGTYYIDGVQSGTTTAALNVTYANTDWTLGKDYRDNDNYFDGLMDDMRVYDIALSSNQVAALYGLEGYWKFDEGTGTVANDSSGNNNTGTIVGNPAWVTGRLGDALDFGNNQYVSIPGTSISSAIATSGQMTATAWVYVNSATASGTIIKSWPTDSGNDQFELGFQGSTGKISGYIEQTNGTIIGPVQATSSLSLNSWHLVALTANGSSTLLYIDGSVVASTTYNGTIHQGGNYIGIGAQLNNTGSPSATPGYFNGILDDVHLYNRGLLPEEILTLMEVLPGQVLNLQATGTYATGFSLTWNPNPAIDNVTGYLVQYSTDGGNTWNATDTDSTSPSYLLTNVAPGDYLFRVQAVNVVGQGPPSAQVGINSPIITYTLDNACADLEHISTNPGDAYGHYIMSANIDCSSVPNFVPITFPTGFGGTFDGAGHTISNLNISTSTIEDVGLFSQIQNGAIVENLALTNANVTSGEPYSGILAGYNDGTLQNISVSGTSTGSYSVGGLVGQNDGLGVISTSSADVSVIGDTSNGDVEVVGGFVGESEGNINGSYSLGAVTNATGSDDLYYAGGFAGLEGGDMSDDYSTGPVIVTADSSGESDYIGGFVGQAENAGSIDNSYSTGNITDPDDYLYAIGGFVGISGATLANDYSTGNIYNADDSNSDSYYLGGFVGYPSTNPISNCYATGSITEAYPQGVDYVGGFSGYNETTISQSYSTGNVQGGQAVGGFSGYSDYTLSEVYSTGNAVLFGSGPAGGLVGYNEGEIDDAYATGSVSLGSGASGNPINIGGLVGYNYDANINRAYASGGVSAGTNSSNVGGLIGYDTSDNSYGNSLTNSYSVGTVTGGTDVGGLIGLEFIPSSGNPSYTDLAWYPGSSSDVVGDFQSNSGSTDNGPIANLSASGYGTDESTVSNFYSTTEPVYAQGQGGAWDFSAIWEAHSNAYPTFQWAPQVTSPTTPPSPAAPAPSGGSTGFSGGSVQGQVSNLLQNGDTTGAAALEHQYSWLFPSVSASGASSTPAALCTAQTYPTEPIKFGGQNDPAQVKLLEQYLDTYENADLPVTGIYSQQDESAVIAWQEKYAADILTPWNITKGTGYVYTTSLKKFRELFLAQCQGTSDESGQGIGATSVSSRDLEIGMSGSDVRSLQQALIAKMTGPAAQALAANGTTGYFGQLTQSALIEFQKAHGIAPAAGYYGPKTKAVLPL